MVHPLCAARAEEVSKSRTLSTTTCCEAPVIRRHASTLECCCVATRAHSRAAEQAMAVRARRAVLRPKETHVAANVPRGQLRVVPFGLISLRRVHFVKHSILPSDSSPRSCTQREILTFGCTELILSHDKLLSMAQVTHILTHTYIIHTNTHMGPCHAHIGSRGQVSALARVPAERDDIYFREPRSRGLRLRNSRVDRELHERTHWDPEMAAHGKMSVWRPPQPAQHP